jgi:purine-nucleoside phosphorylase
LPLETADDLPVERTRMQQQYSSNQVEAYFYGNPKPMGQRILFIKRDQRLAEYRAYLTNVHEFGNVWYGITGSFRGKRMSIVVAGVGPGLVGDAVYALNRPNTICLYSGTCGGLAEESEIGDYVVAEQAACGDGYSLHLGHPAFSLVSGDPGSLKSLRHSLTSRVERSDRGVTFTTSSVVREADPDFWNTVDMQCRAIEMGAAAFYAAAQATGKKAASYFWVTDLPLRGKSFFDPPTPEDTRTRQDRYDRAASLDLELLDSL